jgi:hypothetical protein
MFGNKVQRKRRSLARSLERVSVPERPYIGRGPRYLVHPEVALACAPSLRSMAAALRNETVAFDDNELRAIRSFISDGAGSTFFGRDATAALREAVCLQHAVLGPTANDHDRDRAIMENDDALVSRTVSVITATVVAALLFAVPALGNNGDGNGSSSGNPRLFQLMLEKNGVVDHSVVDPQASTYRNAIHPALEEHGLNWYEIGIGLGISLALALGVMLMYRTTRQNRRLAH